MVKQDLALMARKLALRHVATSADVGWSEHGIALSWHGSGRGHKHWKDDPDGFGGYQVSIGGYYDLDVATGLKRKKVGNTKVLVTEVCGVEGVWIFSLHELYQEARKGQLSLL